MEPTLLTRREAAARVRLSLRAFDRLLAIGAGPLETRLGGRTFIRSDHLESWLSENSGRRGSIEASDVG